MKNYLYIDKEDVSIENQIKNIFSPPDIYPRKIEYLANSIKNYDECEKIKIIEKNNIFLDGPSSYRIRHFYNQVSVISKEFKKDKKNFNLFYLEFMNSCDLSINDLFNVKTNILDVNDIISINSSIIFSEMGYSKGVNDYDENCIGGPVYGYEYIYPNIKDASSLF